MEEQERPLNLISLESKNVCVLRAVRVTPDGDPVITIGGKNGAGKSSLLRSLQMSLCGGKEIPNDPIRHGERHASVKTVLGRDGEAELTIELELSSSKDPKLVVRDKSGSAIKTPQSVLNKLFTSVAFDPLEFSGYPKDKKEAVIRDLAVPKLDFSELDLNKKAEAEDRKLASRDLKELDARLKAMAFEHRGVPAEEISVADLVKTMSTAIAHNAARAAAAKKREDLALANTMAHRELGRLEELLAAAKVAAHAAATRVDEAAEAFDALAPEQPVEAIQTQLSTAEETNQKIRHNKARKELEAQLKACETKVAKHDSGIEAIDKKKLDMIAAAKFPVPELSYDPNDGLLLNGTLLEQASDGQKLRLSVAIAIALHPKLGLILIRQGSLLDKAALRMIAEMAREAGVQVLIEMVTESAEGCSIYIENGEIVETASAAE